MINAWNIFITSGKRSNDHVCVLVGSISFLLQSHARRQCGNENESDQWAD